MQGVQTVDGRFCGGLQTQLERGSVEGGETPQNVTN